MISFMPFCALYVVEQAGRKNANIVMADLSFLHTLPAGLIRRMCIHNARHVRIAGVSSSMYRYFFT